jgi:YfiH family protein
MDPIQSTILSSVTWLEHRFGTRGDPATQAGMAATKQIHSARCLMADTDGCLGEGDALVTRRPGLAVSVRTADCFPILLVDQEHRAIAAVHAGWRGTADEIVRRTIDTMRAQFDTTPGRIVAAIGPGIGVCCYHVGEDVARRLGLDRAGWIDLAAANRAQMVAAGVPEDQIDTLGLCTFCDPARFDSYRRDKEEAGRMISYIRIAEQR